ncbi:unnamed protein product [Mycena citricolor]|uniref:Uncharacterized protein n=1 Tax=Mycena citricolor TaxID=2018698 RepID=A0AAD2JUS8_9AGAR|nr:unnamed protein product [Mycena citricolor]
MHSASAINRSACICLNRPRQTLLPFSGCTWVDTRMLSLIVVALFLSQAIVAASFSRPPPEIRGLKLKRELTEIPTTCQAGCAPFGPFLTGASCSVTQCCLSAFQKGYFNCFTCAGTAVNATDYTLAQEYVDVLTTSCIGEGMALPVLTFPGQDQNRALATALPPDASAVPVFASAAVPTSTAPVPAVPSPSKSSAAGRNLKVSVTVVGSLGLLRLFL